MTRRKLYGSLPAIVGLVLAISTNAYAIVGRPLTPVSFAGVARRSVRRSAYAGAYAAPYDAPYATPYAVPPVAAPVAVPVPPAGCSPGVNCGGVVYKPYYSGDTVVYAPE